MNIVVALFWVTVAVSYLRFRIGDGLGKADVAMSAALLTFAASSWFEGEVFWLPTWNLYLKLSSMALLMLSFAMGAGKGPASN